MKKPLSLLLSISLILGTLAFSFVTATADFSKSGAEFTKGISVGWNLGNTLDAAYPWSGTWTDPVAVNTVETAWGNPKTTQAMITTVKNAGFNAVRIPISWYRFVTVNNGVYTIRTEWINRIKEVVGYAYNQGMYVIINMHHDDGNWLDVSASDTQWNSIVDQYSQLWTIIANEFKTYDEKLIFEAANEITATYVYDGCSTNSGKCWWGHNTNVFTRQNQLYQAFYNIVRNSGGNNNLRYLMYPTYGAQWYSNQYNKVWLPTGDNHSIVDIHWYNTSTAASSYTSTFSALKTKFINNGVGVVFGECGLTTSTQAANGAAWASAFIGTARSYDIACFIWDDGGSFKALNRSAGTWANPTYVSAIASAGTPVPTTTTAPIVYDSNVVADFENGQIAPLAVNVNNTTSSLVDGAGLGGSKALKLAFKSLSYVPGEDTFTVNVNSAQYANSTGMKIWLKGTTADFTRAQLKLYTNHIDSSKTETYRTVNVPISATGGYLTVNWGDQSTYNWYHNGVSSWEYSIPNATQINAGLQKIGISFAVPANTSGVELFVDNIEFIVPSTPTTTVAPTTVPTTTTASSNIMLNNFESGVISPASVNVNAVTATVVDGVGASGSKGLKLVFKSIGYVPGEDTLTVSLNSSQIQNKNGMRIWLKGTGANFNRAQLKYYTNHIDSAKTETYRSGTVAINATGGYITVNWGDQSTFNWYHNGASSWDYTVPSVAQMRSNLTKIGISFAVPANTSGVELIVDEIELF